MDDVGEGDGTYLVAKAAHAGAEGMLHDVEGVVSGHE